MKKSDDAIRTSMKRIKLYQLEDEEWIDKGTGYVECSVLERTKALTLVVTSEDTDQILLEEKVSQENIYQKQQGTLIVWLSPEKDVRFALSFQELTSCEEIWSKICAEVRNKRNEAQTARIFSPGNNNSEENLKLPPVNLNHIDELVQFFTEPPPKRQAITAAILKDDKKYLQQLVDLFHTCEDLEDLTSLHKIFNIFKGLVLLNENGLLEVLFTEKWIIEMMGALEYDPDIAKKQNHRSYLENVVKFKQVVPFNNKQLVDTIHQTFRIQYLKDVVLPRFLDDQTFTTLNSWIILNHQEIVAQIQQDKHFLSELFRKFEEYKEGPELRDLINFVQELFNLSKVLQFATRVSFFSTMLEEGLISILELLLPHPDIAIRLSAVNIVDSFVCTYLSLLRKVIVSQKPQATFFQVLINQFLCEPDSGIRIQLLEILKMLLFLPNTSYEEGEHFFPCLDIFYNSFFDKLIEPLSQEPVEIAPGSIGVIQEQICDLLSFCLQHHSYRARRSIQKNNVIVLVMNLIRTKKKNLTLAAIKFFRILISTKEDLKQIIKLNLFDLIFDAFKSNGERYNLLNSAIIELFEFISKENLKPLIQHLGDKYSDYFKKIGYVETFDKILIKYEQIKEASSNGTLPVSQSAPEPPREDEDYFQKSDSEGEDTQVEKKDPEERKFIERPLVPYPPDEDEMPPLSATKETTTPLSKRKRPTISFNLKTCGNESNQDPLQPNSALENGKRHKS